MPRSLKQEAETWRWIKITYPQCFSHFITYEEMDVPLGSQPKKELTSASNLIFLSMNEQLKSDLLKNEADEFWADCERKAAELEITVDYYLDEFL